MLDKPWISSIPKYEQERFKPVTKYIYSPALGSFNNCNNILLSQKSTPSDAFDEIQQVLLDGISDIMDSLFESGTYGAVNTTDTETHGFYVIVFISEAYTLR